MSDWLCCTCAICFASTSVNDATLVCKDDVWDDNPAVSLFWHDHKMIWFRDGFGEVSIATTWVSSLWRSFISPIFRHGSSLKNLGSIFVPLTRELSFSNTICSLQSICSGFPISSWAAIRETVLWPHYCRPLNAKIEERRGHVNKWRSPRYKGTSPMQAKIW